MTADSYSSVLGYLQMGTGNDNNTWGTNATEGVFQIFENAIAGTLTSAVTGGTLDLSGSPPPGGASQAAYGILIFTGTLAANQTVKFPNVPMRWKVYNATSVGTFALLFEVSGGAGTCQVPFGTTKEIWADGNGNIFRNDINEVGTIRYTAAPLARWGELICDGTAYLRANFPDLFGNIAISTTGNTTSTSYVITNIPSTAGMVIGHPISGAGIPTGTSITSIDSSSQIHISNAATATITGGAIVVAPWGVGDGLTTFNVPILNDYGRYLRAAGAGFGVGEYLASSVISHNHSASASASSSTSVSVSISDPSHNHSNNDPTHAHSVYDPSHNHYINDPSHTHGINIFDPSHAHSVYDAGHTHGVNGGIYGGKDSEPTWVGGGSYSGYSSPFEFAAIGINVAGTGISIYGAYTGITASANGAFTGIYNSAAGTGIGIYAAYTGVTNNAATTGITASGSASTSTSVSVTTGNTGGSDTYPVSAVALATISY